MTKDEIIGTFAYVGKGTINKIFDNRTYLENLLKQNTMYNTKYRVIINNRKSTISQVVTPFFKDDSIKKEIYRVSRILLEENSNDVLSSSYLLGFIE